MIKSIFRPLSEERTELFGFGFFEYDTDLSLFIENAEKEIHRVKTVPDFLFPRTLQERMSSVIRLCLGLPFPR